MNVGVHTLTKGYFLKYSGVDFSGALAALTLTLAPAALAAPALLFLPPIECNESNECNGLLDIVYYNIIVYVVYTPFIRAVYYAPQFLILLKNSMIPCQYVVKYSANKTRITMAATLSSNPSNA